MRKWKKESRLFKTHRRKKNHSCFNFVKHVIKLKKVALQDFNMNVYDYANKLLDKLSNDPLTTDKISIENNENTFDLAKDLLKNYQLFPDYEKCNLFGNRKSNELATKLRLKGNDLFRDRKYFSALCAYNESLCYAETDSENLGLAFANRSAVFLKIEEFGLSKENIELAKEFGYPSSKFDKLEKRKEKCYEEIENISDSEDLTPLQLTQELNLKYPFIAKCLRLRNNPEYGRLVISDRALNIGEVVAIERPFCGLLLAKYQIERCTNCLGQFKMNLIPCHNCASGKNIVSKLRTL